MIYMAALTPNTDALIQNNSLIHFWIILKPHY